MARELNVALPGTLTGSSLSASGVLPEDLSAEATRRLVILMLIAAGVYALYLLLYLGPFADSGQPVQRWVSAAQIVLSLGLAWHLSRGRCVGTSVVRFGILYEVLLADSVAFVEYATISKYDYTIPVDTVSWTCVIIILFPMLLPMRQAQALAASLAAASSNIVALSVNILWCDLQLDALVIVSLLIPPYVCAFVAVVPARVLHRLGKAVRQARRLGAYELVERLGAGGMGEVWRAEHHFLARPAAVKLIRPEVLGARDDATRAVMMERFEREAQATASLESPHTVGLFDFGVSADGTLYYVMEYLAGLDLKTLVERFGPLPPGRVVHLLVQACDSLAEAHAAGLVHRDIKPANLVVGRRGRHLDWLRVLDFGLVKRHAEGPLAPRQDHTLTQDGALTGTPAYLSPEAVTGSMDVGPSADLYALGCVAFWLLTGRLVFDEATPMQVAVAHATRPAPAPSEVAEEAVPEALDQLVLSCLAKDPSDRPASAAALQDALAACEGVQPWTRADGEAWWKRHAPEVVSAG